VQADAAVLPLADRSADALLCCFALMHMVSPAAAAAEFARVLRPGGSIAITTWGPDVPWPAHEAVVELLDELGAPKVASSHHGAPITESPQNVAAMLRDAGFGSVTVEQRPFAEEELNLEAALYEWSSLGSTATRISALDPPAQQDFFARARVVMAKFVPAGYAEPSDVIYAWGVRS
jgi:SAM-dependent methyltransferase